MWTSAQSPTQSYRLQRGLGTPDVSQHVLILINQVRDLNSTAPIRRMKSSAKWSVISLSALFSLRRPIVSVSSCVSRRVRAFIRGKASARHVWATPVWHHLLASGQRHDACARSSVSTLSVASSTYQLSINQSTKPIQKKNICVERKFVT